MFRLIGLCGIAALTLAAWVTCDTGALLWLSVVGGAAAVVALWPAPEVAARVPDVIVRVVF